MGGVLISTAAQLILAIPLMLLFNPKYTHLKEAMLFGKAGLCIYMAFFIIWGAVSFIKLWEVSVSISLPVENKLLAAFMIALVCLYASRLGLQVLARGAVLVLGLLGAALILMLIGAYSKIELLNLVRNEELNSVWLYALRDFCESGELVALIILLYFTENNHKKSVFSYLAAKLVLIELFSFIGITVLGNLMQTARYPFFEIGAYTQPFSTQRSDAIYIILFTFLCTINITIQIILSSILIHELFPKFKYAELSSISAMLILSFIINSTSINFEFLWGAFIIILSAIIPLIMYTRRKLNGITQNES